MFRKKHWVEINKTQVSKYTKEGYLYKKHLDNLTEAEQYIKTINQADWNEPYNYNKEDKEHWNEICKTQFLHFNIIITIFGSIVFLPILIEIKE